MNRIKFRLADLFLALGVLGFGFFCFLSMNFITLGDTVKSVIAATLISVVLGGIAFGLKLLKSTKGRFKIFIVWEWVLLLFFIAAAFFATFPFSHYFTVWEQKSEIQKEAVLNILKAERLFNEYEIYAEDRISMYKRRLESVVKNEGGEPIPYDTLGFNDPADDESQIITMVRALKNQLYPSNYNEMKKLDSLWLSEAKSKILNWSPTGVVKVVNTFESEINSWIRQLVYYSEARVQGESPSTNNFSFEIEYDNVTTKINKQHAPSPLAIIIAILFYVLMLLSYVVTNRSTKSKYTLFSIVTKKKSSKDDEIDVII